MSCVYRFFECFQSPLGDPFLQFLTSLKECGISFLISFFSILFHKTISLQQIIYHLAFFSPPLAHLILASSWTSGGSISIVAPANNISSCLFFTASSTSHFTFLLNFWWFQPQLYHLGAFNVLPWSAWST